MGVHERRRLVLATAFTVVALPAIWLLDRDDTAPTPTSAAAGVPTPGAAPGAATTSYVPEPPVFLDNTAVLPLPAVIDIAVPGTAKPTERTVDLTYKDYAAYAQGDLCTLPAAPSGATLSVTNVDNGQSVTCTNDLRMEIPIGAEMAIDMNLYVRLANLVDAPVPVVVSW